MENKYQQITICKFDFKTEEEFEKAVNETILLLLKLDYVMTVKWDDKGLGVLVIKFQYDKPEFGCAFPYWLSVEEQDSVVWDDLGKTE